MLKFIKILICFIVVDFFFFSTKMSFTRGLNTKELMAVVGIILFFADLYRNKEPVITREFLSLLVYSILISLFAIFSAVIHNTQERTYTTYFVSMLVWLSASFVVVKCIQAVHGQLSIELIAKYIVAVSVAQCLIAIIADNYAPLDSFILRVVPGTSWVKSENRLFGFGDTSVLDTGGIRYAIASVLCAFNLINAVRANKTASVPIYFLAFLIIGLIGNMIARTTIVGTIIGLIYLLIFLFPYNFSIVSTSLKAWLWLLLEASLVVTIVASLYITNEKFYQRTRFGFEGFFSLVEEGHWKSSSNEKLKTMYVFPDNPETWLIGDGYFISPYYDKNYLGEANEGYYKGTDVGYLRFIFFFGIIGLLTYSAFIIYAGRVCSRLNPGNKFLFALLTLMNFIIWFKVATDCFFILCLFISLGYVKNSMEEVSPPELERLAQ